VHKGENPLRGRGGVAFPDDTSQEMQLGDRTHRT